GKKTQRKVYFGAAIENFFPTPSLPGGDEKFYTTPLCPPPAGPVWSRTMPTRATFGINSRRRSNHLALRPYSNRVKPVILPPGRARLFTILAPTGSMA